MKSKINMLLLATLLTSSYAFAQETKFGLTAGTTFAHLSSKYSATRSGPPVTGLRPGFTVGVLAKVPRYRNIIIQPVFSFIQKGGYAKSNYSQNGKNDKISAGFFDLTLNYVYMPGKDAGFFIGAGPSFSTSIYGKSSVQTPQGELTSSSLYHGNHNIHIYNPFQASANILTGYSFRNGLSLSVNYNHDLLIQPKYSYFGLRLDLMRNREK